MAKFYITRITYWDYGSTTSNVISPKFKTIKAVEKYAKDHNISLNIQDDHQFNTIEMDYNKRVDNSVKPKENA